MTETIIAAATIAIIIQPLALA